MGKNKEVDNRAVRAWDAGADDCFRFGTTFSIDILAFAKRHQLWKSAAPKQIELLNPDWSFLKVFEKLIKMGLFDNCSFIVLRLILFKR